MCASLNFFPWSSNNEFSISVSVFLHKSMTVICPEFIGKICSLITSNLETNTFIVNWLLVYWYLNETLLQKQNFAEISEWYFARTNKHFYYQNVGS